MPDVVSATIAVVKSFWSWATTTKIIGQVTVAAVIKTAGSVVVSHLVSKALAPKLGPGALSNASPLQLTRDPVAPRRVIYGETRVSGPMLDAFVAGTNNEFMHMVIGLAGHQCQAIGDVYFNDEVVALDGSGNVTGTLAGYARVKKALGSTGQTADSDFVSDSGGQRSSDDKFDRIAYLYCRYKWDQAKWPSGWPNPSAVVKGRLCYDPRTTSTAWTDNPALCIRDYLTNTEFGLGVDSSEIDDTSFIEAANICDELVDLAAGGTEKRYRCNGSFETSAEPASVLDQLAQSMAGLVAYVGGKWICHAGAHRTPETSTLDEDDLRAPISVQTKLSLRDTCNRVRGTFSSPDEKWQPADFTPILNSTYLSEDGGLEIWRDLSFAFVTSHSQAQRLAKIELERTRQDITATMPCKLTALRYKPGDVVPVDNTELGWSGKLFVVTELKFTTFDVNGELALGVDLTLRETASAVWDWNDGEETTYDPAPNTTLWDERTVETPSGLAAAVAAASERTALPRVKLTWTLPTSQFIRSGGRAEIQYKKTADSDWTEWNSVPGNQNVEYVSDLQIGTATQFRLRYINSAKVPGAYCSAVSVTPQAGEGNYVVNLTNARHLVRANAEGTVTSGELGSGGRATTDCQAWAGNVALTAVASSPGVGQFAVSASVIEGTATFTKEDADTFRLDTLGSDRTVVRLTFDLEGLDTRTEDWILWKSTDGGAYWLLASAAAVNKSAAGAYTPADVLFSAKAILSIAGLGNYSGRFKIATFDGSWTDVYTSASDESSKNFTVPAGTFTKLRCQLYKAGSFSTFLDEIEIPIVNDGVDGDDGTDGTNGATVLGLGGGGGTVNSTSYADTTPPMLATFDTDGGDRIAQTSASQITNAGSSTQTCYAGLFIDGVLVAEWVVSLAVGESDNFVLIGTAAPAAGVGKEARVKFKGSGGGNVAGGTTITVQ